MPQDLFASAAAGEHDYTSEINTLPFKIQPLQTTVILYRIALQICFSKHFFSLSLPFSRSLLNVYGGEGSVAETLMRIVLTGM